MAIVAAIIVVAGAGYWWFNRPAELYQADNSGLYPITVDGKYGFMDRSGKPLIAPQFEKAFGFSEGLAQVRIGGKSGYINTKGVVVITPQFDDALQFQYGRAAVKLCCGLGWQKSGVDRFGFIDKDGKYIGSPNFHWIGSFSGDLAPVETADAVVGFVDRSGKLVVSGKFDSLFHTGFSEGLAPVGSGGKWGYIDSTGKWAIEPQFGGASNFADGLARVVVSGRTGYIDKKGKFVVNPQYDSGDEFYDGYASFSSAGKFGFIDSKGHVVVEAKFLSAAHFSDGLAPVKTDEGWGFIDSAGKLVVTAQFDGADAFRGGLAKVAIGSQLVYVDKSGSYIGDPFKGHEVKPAHAVQEIWEGDIVSPNFKEHARFLLIREGTKIKGFYSSPHPDPASLSNFVDVAADVGSNDAVSLRGENETLWKGRFVAPIVIAGTWSLTHPGGDGNTPEFPFRIHFVMDATSGEIPTAMPPTDTDWNAFQVKFKQAVTERDQAVLGSMLARGFYLQNSRIRSAEEVFRKLNWPELSKAVAEGESSKKKSPLGRQIQVITDNHPCAGCKYAVSLGFAADGDGQWRWTGVTYPGD